MEGKVSADLVNLNWDSGTSGHQRINYANGQWHRGRGEPAERAL